MKFTEIDLFGVYVAPMSLLMVAAWVITIALRRVEWLFCRNERAVVDLELDETD